MLVRAKIFEDTALAIEQRLPAPLWRHPTGHGTGGVTRSSTGSSSFMVFSRFDKLDVLFPGLVVFVPLVKALCSVNAS